MVGVWILRKTGGRWEHLQLKRAEGDYMGGTWSLCRGGVEAGETAVAAALREMREETGLAPAEMFRLGTLEQFYTSAHDTIWVAPFFAAFVGAGAEVTVNEEHSAFRWVADAEMDEALVWPSEEHLLREIRKYVLRDHPTKALMKL